MESLQLTCFETKMHSLSWHFDICRNNNCDMLRACFLKRFLISEWIKLYFWRIQAHCGPDFILRLGFPGLNSCHEKKKSPSDIMSGLAFLHMPWWTLTSWLLLTLITMATGEAGVTWPEVPSVFVYALSFLEVKPHESNQETCPVPSLPGFTSTPPAILDILGLSLNNLKGQLRNLFNIGSGQSELESNKRLNWLSLGPSLEI